ncbi:MoaD/ThiS family protein [Roseivirga sp. BDSF3-8]|uniref:MoaD/ThiS family protein n=1 Tax=Roseivirga sp. BDSF3-8 TaxID=3241598 RepID=UPI0035325BB2
MAKLIIPTPLRKFTGNQSSLDASGQTVNDALEQLALTYPDLQKQIFDDQGKLRNFIKVYVGDEDIKGLNNGETRVGNESVISIVPAIAGGTR